MEPKLSDKLAIERTRLANERTFLAYFRSAIVFSSSGAAILKLDMFEEVKWIGSLLIIVGPILLIIGLIRLIYVKKKIKNAYQDYES